MGQACQGALGIGIAAACVPAEDYLALTLISRAPPPLYGAETYRSLCGSAGYLCCPRAEAGDACFIYRTSPSVAVCVDRGLDTPACAPLPALLPLEEGLAPPMTHPCVRTGNAWLLHR